MISFALVKCRDLQETQRRVASVVIRLYEKDPITNELIPPTRSKWELFLGDLERSRLFLSPICNS